VDEEAQAYVPLAVEAQASPRKGLAQNVEGKEVRWSVLGLPLHGASLHTFLLHALHLSSLLSVLPLYLPFLLLPLPMVV